MVNFSTPQKDCNWTNIDRPTGKHFHTCKNVKNRRLNVVASKSRDYLSKLKLSIPQLGLHNLFQAFMTLP
jgi:hypothetical protein